MCSRKRKANNSLRKRAKVNFHPILDAGGNIVAKAEEKAEVLNACFASPFNSKMNCSQGTSSLSRKTGGRRKAP